MTVYVRRSVNSKLGISNFSRTTSSSRVRIILAANNATLDLLDYPSHAQSEPLASLTLSRSLATLWDNNIFNIHESSPTCARSDANTGAVEGNEGSLVGEGHV
jgi:hypothetical protein